MPRNRSFTIALWAVALMLAGNLLLSLTRRDGSPDRPWLPAAMAQRQAPIAGGAGLFVMPAQLSGNTWGCYLMDVDRGTLAVYQFQPGPRSLQFVASRLFGNDLKLDSYNTTPTPQEIADLVERQARGVRPIPPAPEDQPK